MPVERHTKNYIILDLNDNGLFKSMMMISVTQMKLVSEEFFFFPFLSLGVGLSV